jgi:hypothetical protein
MPVGGFGAAVSPHSPRFAATAGTREQWRWLLKAGDDFGGEQF